MRSHYVDECVGIFEKLVSNLYEREIINPKWDVANAYIYDVRKFLDRCVRGCVACGTLPNATSNVWDHKVYGRICRSCSEKIEDRENSVAEAAREQVYRMWRNKVEEERLQREEKRKKNLARLKERGGVQAKTRFIVLERDGFSCRYCGRSAPDVELHVDHVVPLAAGGHNTQDNLVAACVDCNLGKGKRPLRAAA